MIRYYIILYYIILYVIWYDITLNYVRSYYIIVYIYILGSMGMDQVIYEIPYDWGDEHPFYPPLFWGEQKGIRGAMTHPYGEVKQQNMMNLSN